MRLRGSTRLVLTLSAPVVLASCGNNRVSGVLQLGQVTRVRAFDAVTNVRAVTVAMGGTARVALMEYDTRDSTLSIRAEWVSRNTAVVSISGSSLTAQSAGQTYVVAQISDNGHAFADSLLVTVGH